MTPKLSRGALLGPSGRYRIDRWLSHGRFGQAYRAYDRRLGRTAVIKRLKLDPGWSPDDCRRARQSFAHESQLLVSLNFPGFPGIPEIYDYLEEDHCLALRYIEGETLFNLVSAQRDGRLPEVEALCYIRDACAGLVYMHGRSPVPVLHRDIKPNNIIRDLSGHAWLIDFGISRLFTSADVASPSSGVGEGTDGYSPPEQDRGQAEPRSDVYALSATLYALLTGYRVGELPDRWVLAHQGQISIRPAVIALIDSGLALDVANRPDASAFLSALDRLIDRQSLLPLPSVAPPLMSDGLAWIESAVDDLSTRLHDRHVVVITGAGGAGKTTLLTEIAFRHADPQHIFWYGCRSGSGFDLLATSFAGFLAQHCASELWSQIQITAESGVRPLPDEIICDYLIQHLCERGYLLCFDDLHTVENDPRSVALLSHLVAAALHGRLSLLVSTQFVPNIIPHELLVALDGHPVADGRRFLRMHAPWLSSGQVDRLHAALAGNLLHLRHALAALTTVADTDPLIDMLAGADDRDRALLVAVDAALTDSERKVLQALSLLHGDDGGAAMVAAMLTQLGVAALLESLEARALLAGSDGTLMGRHYRLHGPAQAFYRAQVTPTLYRTWNLRAAEYYRSEAPDPMRAALHYAEAGDVRQAAALVTAEIRVLVGEGHTPALTGLLDSFVGLQAQFDPAQWVQVLIARGELYARRREDEQSCEIARAAFSTALEQMAALPNSAELWVWEARIYRGMAELLEYKEPEVALGLVLDGLKVIDGRSPMDQAALHIRAGSLLLGRNDSAAAIDALEQALADLGETPNLLRADALNNLGIACCKQGDIARGVGYYQAVLTLQESIKDQWGKPATLHNLGIAREDSGDWGGALADYQQALRLACQLGDVSVQIQVELSIALQETACGHTAAALDRLERNLACATDLNLDEICIYLLTSRADLELRQGHHSLAVAPLDMAEQLVEMLQTDAQLSEIRRGQAQIWQAQGDLATAQQAADAAVALAVQQDSAFDLGVSHRVRAKICHACADLSAARHEFEESLTILDAIANVYEAARTRLWWGRTLVESGNLTVGQELIAAAEATLRQLGASIDMA